VVITSANSKKKMQIMMMILSDALTLSD